MIKKILLIFMICSSGVCAMQIVYESLDTVLKKTQCAILVQIQSVDTAQEDRLYKTIEFSAIPLKVILGELKSHEKLRLVYSEGRPHVRGEMAISPLVSGSGLEFNLKKGAKVIVLTDSVNTISTPLNVLRVEPTENITYIERYRTGTLKKDAEHTFPAAR